MATWGTGISLKGSPGSKIYFGTGTPTDATSTVQGDAFFATDTQLFYQRGASSWGTGTLLRGAMGLTGVSGASFYSGPGVPDSSVNGNDGDLYLDLANGEIYKHVNGAWADQSYSILGPVGPQGPQGNQGATIRGTQTYTGSGAPSSNLSSFTPTAVAGDLYYDIGTTGGPYFYVLGS